MKRFSVDEAEALIPEIEAVFEAVAALVRQAQAKAEEAGRLEEGDAGAAETALAKSQVRFLTAQIEERLQSIVELGALPKGLEPPLVDFPSTVEGRDVFLCWARGESSIDWYHGVEEGFSSRKRLRKRRPS
jgi:hypothetical protein